MVEVSRLPDISEYYTGDRAVKEEVAWIMQGEWKRYFQYLQDRLKKYDVISIVEFGCGSGLLASAIPEKIGYVGIDRNAWFIGRARARCPTREFVIQDVRATPVEDYSLAMCFNFLKNFRLDEWVEVAGLVLAQGRYGCLHVQMCANEFDDGKDYHHTFVNEERLQKAIKAAGHVEILMEREVTNVWNVGIETCQDVCVWTRRISDGLAGSGRGGATGPARVRDPLERRPEQARDGAVPERQAGHATVAPDR